MPNLYSATGVHFLSVRCPNPSTVEIIMNRKKIQRVFNDQIQKHVVELRQAVFEQVLRMPLRYRLIVAFKIVFKRLPHL
jgi:hypothetical protein